MRVSIRASCPLRAIWRRTRGRYWRAPSGRWTSSAPRSRMPSERRLRAISSTSRRGSKASSAGREFAAWPSSPPGSTTCSGRSCCRGPSTTTRGSPGSSTSRRSCVGSGGATVPSLPTSAGSVATSTGSAAARLTPVVDETADVPGRHDQGGWSQARYERHIENIVDRHLREVADALDRCVAWSRACSRRARRAGGDSRRVRGPALIRGAGGTARLGRGRGARRCATVARRGSAVARGLACRS